MSFPQTRLRRLRSNRALRGLVRETRLTPAEFIYPMFVAHGVDRREPIPAMPGIDHLSIAHAVQEAGEAHAMGDEHREDELRRRQPRLAHETAERPVGAEPSQAGLRERHSGEAEDNGGLGPVCTLVCR